MPKLTDRAALGAAPAVGDLLFVTDVSDTTDAAGGTDKKMTVTNLFTSPTLTTPVLGVASATSINGATITSGTLNGSVTGTNTGDQTSIVGITGTKAQFDTAVSDGNIMYDGDSITNAVATADRVFYANNAGVITELALGADGTFLKSNGATAAPTFATPAGSGDVTKVGTPADNQVGVWTGNGTIEGSTTLTFDSATNRLNSEDLVISETPAQAQITTLVIGTGATLTPNIQILNATTSASLGQARFAGASATVAPQNSFCKSRGATIGDYTIVASGDLLGAQTWGGSDGTDFAPAASMSVLVDGTPGNNDMPGRIVFSTTPDGATAVTDRIIIDSAGAIKPATSDGSALGNTTNQFSDLFLAEGGVINFDNGDLTLTQSGNTLTLAGGDLVLAENTSVQLDPTLSADGTYTGTTITGTAGATLAFGDLIYLAVADSRWELVDADAVATCGAVLTGMCVLAAAGDASATTILLQGNIRADAAFPALTVGANVYAGLTPGDIVTTAPSATDDVVHVVGKALTADSIYFNPSMDYITIV